jgi:hypothetical protein
MSRSEKPHPLAGRTVRLPNGALFRVEDWWARVRPDDQDPRHPRSPGHAVYVARCRDPVPGVYGHIGSLGYILAPDELDGAGVVG